MKKSARDYFLRNLPLALFILDPIASLARPIRPPTHKIITPATDPSPILTAATHHQHLHK